MADFPRVVTDGRSLPLRFSLPAIKFGPDTIVAYEQGCGIPYLEILSAVLEIDEPNHEDGSKSLSERLKQGRVNKKAESTAQGMLFYLYNLFSLRSRIGAIQPPINSSMVVWWRKKYPFFDDTVNEFEHELCDAAEDELYQRAVLGTDAPVVVNGQIEYVTKKSDDLLKFYLTHNRPRRYSQKTEVKASVDMEANVKAAITLDRSAFAHMSDDELAAMEEALNRAKS